MRHVMTHRYTLSTTSFTPRVRVLGQVDDSTFALAQFAARSAMRRHCWVPPMSSNAPVVTL